MWHWQSLRYAESADLLIESFDVRVSDYASRTGPLMVAVDVISSTAFQAVKSDMSMYRDSLEVKVVEKFELRTFMRFLFQNRNTTLQKTLFLAAGIHHGHWLSSNTRSNVPLGFTHET